jgi:hypothetical protein
LIMSDQKTEADKAVSFLKKRQSKDTAAAT